MINNSRLIMSNDIGSIIQRKLDGIKYIDASRKDVLLIAFLFYVLKKNNVNDFVALNIDEILKYVGKTSIANKLKIIFENIDIMEFSTLYRKDIQELKDYISKTILYRHICKNSDDNQKDIYDLMIELINIDKDKKILLSKRALFNMGDNLINTNVKIFTTEKFDRIHEDIRSRSIIDIEASNDYYIYCIIHDDKIKLLQSVKEIEDSGINTIVFDESLYIYENEIDPFDGIKIEGKQIFRIINTSTFNSLSRFTEERSKKIMTSYIYENKISTVINVCDGRTIIVINKNKNGAIRMIDAKNEYTEDRDNRSSYIKNKYMSNDNIKNIVSAITLDTSISKSVPLEDISANESSINPSDYIEEIIDVENGIVLGECVQEFIRGILIPRGKILSENEISSIKLLSLDNIEDGKIVGNFENVSMDVENLDRYYLKDKDIIIKKNGEKIQMAIFNNINNVNVVPYGNIFVVRLDPSKLNAYYVKNYLEYNDIGRKQFENSKNDSSSIMRNLNKKKFYKIKIPRLDIEKQNFFEKKYKNLMEEINKKKKEIEDLQLKYIDEFNKSI